MTRPANPLRFFNSPTEMIRLMVIMYMRYPLSLRNVADVLFERGFDLCHRTVRFWRNRFGPMGSNPTLLPCANSAILIDAKWAVG